MDSTSCCKDATKSEDTKEVAASSEESDVLSINADTFDSDIEAPKDEQTVKTADDSSKDTQTEKPETVSEPPAVPKPNEPKKDIQSDIDKSVSEILSFSAAGPSTAPSVAQTQPPATAAAASAQSAPATPAVCQPSIQQLELLELEMRARAIKALMKANKKTTE